MNVVASALHLVAVIGYCGEFISECDDEKSDKQISIIHKCIWCDTVLYIEINADSQQIKSTIPSSVPSPHLSSPHLASNGNETQLPTSYSLDSYKLPSPMPFHLVQTVCERNAQHNENEMVVL